MIPDCFRVNDGDWAVHTDAQAIRLRPIYQRSGSSQPEFLEAGFKKFPGAQTDLVRAALWFRLVGAKEDVPFESLQPQAFDRLF